MARRYIGDATVYIRYHDDGDYRGSVVCYLNAHCDRKWRERRVWKFDALRSPKIGFPFASDSPEAYDEMAQSAVSFGSYYTSDNRGDDCPDWAPSPEVADSINEAVGCVCRDDGTYEVWRNND